MIWWDLLAAWAQSGYKGTMDLWNEVSVAPLGFVAVLKHKYSLIPDFPTVSPTTPQQTRAAESQTDLQALLRKAVLK